MERDFKSMAFQVQKHSVEISETIRAEHKYLVMLVREEQSKTKKVFKNLSLWETILLVNSYLTICTARPILYG